MKPILIPATILLTLAAGIPASAATLNLTTSEVGGVPAANSGVINNALFDVTFQQSTGTGVIEPFLRLQSNNAQSYGMNTSANGVLDNKAGKWTHDLQLFELAEVNGHYQFLLDINEPNGSRSLISLEDFTISTAAVGGLTYDDVRQPSIAATLRYDMDGAGDSSVLLDYDRNHGSGSGDLIISVPTSFFAGAAPESYIYLYAGFNKTAGDGSNQRNTPSGGFEEFAAVRNAGGTPVPEAGSALVGMLVLGLAATRFGGRSRKSA